MRCCLLCLSLLFGFSVHSIVQAEDPLVGKRVVVIRDNAPLEVDGKEVAKAADCSVFTVKSVQGNFLWVESEKAYLRRADVVPFEDAIDYYTRQLETNKTAQNYWNRAQIWRLKGELDIALGDINDAIRLNSTESAWFNARGLLWYGKKEYDKAVADYNEAIRLDPKSGVAYLNRSIVWSRRGQYDKAIADCDEALKYLDRSETSSEFDDRQATGGDSHSKLNMWAMACNERSWLLSTCPDEKFRDGPRAVEYAIKACELTEWKFANNLDTLASAYAEVGDFNKAVEWQLKAIDLASGDQKADFESHLKLYQDKKPYRQPVLQ